MAISFSRPDPASPASVSAAQFQTSRRGYDQAAVRDFLRMVAAEQARLQERERFLERELRAAQHAGTPNMAAIDEDTAIRLLGEEAARVLQAAREAAAQIRARAEEGSGRLLREATDEAQRLREEAEIEGARRRQDAAADSEAELQMAKQQGRDMVNEARSYRERVLSELARRRELARQQIEQLIHGRDRLLQAFERSRLAAVEVMAELTPLGEPAEYGNLQPTTGPLPVTLLAGPVPASPPFDAAAEDLVDEELVDDADSTVVLVLNSEAVALAEAGTLAEAEIVELDVVVTDTSAFAVVEVIATEQADDDSENEVMTEADSEVWPAPQALIVAGSDGPAPAVETSIDTVSYTVASGELHLVEPVENAESDPANVIELFADTKTGSGHSPTVSNVGGTVDDLFARLRAARADASADEAAHDVAEGTGQAVDADPELDPQLDQQLDPELDPEEVIVPLIVSVARKLKRVLADEQNEVLDTLRRKEPVRAIDALLPWEAEQSDRYAEAVQTDLVAASVAGARGGEDGGNPSIVRPACDAVTNEIVAPLRERLTRCIDRADGDNVDLAKQVRSLYREWKTHRIDEHVEEIVRLAYERGVLTVATT